MKKLLLAAAAASMLFAGTVQAEGSCPKNQKPGTECWEHPMFTQNEGSSDDDLTIEVITASPLSPREQALQRCMDLTDRIAAQNQRGSNDPNYQMQPYPDCFWCSLKTTDVNR